MRLDSLCPPWPPRAIISTTLVVTLVSTVPTIILLSLAIFSSYDILDAAIRKYLSALHYRRGDRLVYHNRIHTDELRRQCAKVHELETYKILYYRLQNLEAHPEILPVAYDTLVDLLYRALISGKTSKESITSCNGAFTEADLHSFLESESDRLSQDWKHYLETRLLHGSISPIRNREAAKAWLRRISPSKLVDGAWLGHIHKATTPFLLRKFTKKAWQVYSEELGDGDLRKSHVFVFKDLLNSAGINLPDPTSSAFTEVFNDPSQDVQAIRSGVTQLLISLFPDDFLPEILGFNLHFERVTLETLVASKELSEAGLDPTYFRLHVCIDNAHSGHTAMATQTVVEYLDFLHKTQGADKRDAAWQRVQAGYQLSVWTGEGQKVDGVPASRLEGIGSKQLGSKVAKLILDKSSSARDIHCLSKVKIAGLKLTDWLDTTMRTSDTWEEDLLHDLSKAKPWVVRGDSSNSKLIQASVWGGKMFGCFTKSEIEILRDWIDSLAPTSHEDYWRLIGQCHVPRKVLLASRTASQRSFTNIEAADVNLGGHFPVQRPFSGSSIPTLIISEKAVAKGLFSLWFSHISLLESTIGIPARMTSSFGSAILRCLRAQHGFAPDEETTAEAQRSHLQDHPDIVTIGLELMTVFGFEAAKDLSEVLITWPNVFAQQILDMSARPLELQDTLIGTAVAFVELHRAARSYEALSMITRSTLAQLIVREREALEICISEIEQEKRRYRQFVRGYRLGLESLLECCS